MLLCCTLSIMTKLVDDAVRVLRELPENVQAAAARAIIEYGAGYDDDVALSDEQVATLLKPENMTQPGRAQTR